jgi:hypothetical protein
MRRWYFLAAFVFLVTATPAKAKDFYVTQAGRGTGVSCSNPLSVAWFNNTANWGTGVKQIGPGTTVHLCGTFTGGVGQQLLIVRRSGTSTAPITIKFESGARLNSPAWSSMGAISAPNLSYIVVDGGGTGVIQNTGNGTGRAYRRTSVGIYFTRCNGCKVKNITIANLYVHSPNDTTVNQGQVNCVSFVSANNVTIDHVTCHDAGWAFAGMGNNFTLQYSIIYNIDHGVAFGASGVTSGFSIHDNHFYNFANWDTTINKYHHDGVHMWGQNGGRVTNGSIYNNRFDGDSGVNITAFVFLQDSVQRVAVYNNVFTTPNTRVMRSIWFHATSTSMPGGAAMYNSAHNNTVNAGTHREGSGLMADSQLNFSAYNNVLMGGQSDISINGGTTLSGVNNNVYVDLASFGDRNTFGWRGTSYQTLAQWKNTCRCDGNSKFVLPSQVRFSSTGQILGTSAALSAGTNLTSISDGSLSMLASDIIGASRPADGSWDAGAYQSGSKPARPAAVNGVTVSVQ